MHQILKALIKTQLLRDWHCKSCPYPVGKFRELQGLVQIYVYFPLLLKLYFEREDEGGKEKLEGKTIACKQGSH